MPQGLIVVHVIASGPKGPTAVFTYAVSNANAFTPLYRDKGAARLRNPQLNKEYGYEPLSLYSRSFVYSPSPLLT